MPRGILWVASQILDSEKLPEDKFSDWYENMHVQQVLSLPGSPSAVRYQALEPQPVPDAYTVEVPWLVVYELPDLEFRNSDDFTQFAIRNPPSKFEIDDIYQHSRFFIRFYEEKQVVEAPGEQKGPVTFFVSSALQPPSDPESLASFDSWYRDEHLPAMSRMPGFVRSRRYEIASTYKLEKLQPTDLMDQVPKYLALHEFSGETLPWDAFKESLSTEWSKKVLGSLEKKETGWYKVKRVYPESEWGHVGKVAEP